MDYEAVGRRVTERRLALGWTQKQLAERVHGSVSYVSRIETAQRRPSEQTIRKLAEALSCTVHHLIHGSPDPQVLDLEMSFAEMAFWSGDAETSRHRYADLLRTARAGNVEEPTVAKILHGLALAHEALGCFEDALRIFEQLDTMTLPPEIDRLRVRMLICRMYMAAGDLPHSIEVGELALREYRASGLPPTDTWVQLVSTLVNCYYEAGQITRGKMLIDEATSVAERLGTITGRASAYWNAALIEEARCNVSQALHLSRRALALVGEIGERWSLAMLSRNVGWLTLRAGDGSAHPEVRSMLERAFAELVDLGNPGEAAEAQAELAMWYLHAGDLSTALDLAREAAQRAAGGSIIEAAKTRSTFGDILTAAGDHEAAATAFRASAEALTEIGASRHAAAAWRRLGAALVKLGRTEEGLAAYERAMGEGRIPTPMAAPAPGGSVLAAAAGDDLGG